MPRILVGADAFAQGRVLRDLLPYPQTTMMLVVGSRMCGYCHQLMARLGNVDSETHKKYIFAMLDVGDWNKGNTPEYKIGASLGVNSYPTVFFVEPSGMIKTTNVNTQDEGALREAIDAKNGSGSVQFGPNTYAKYTPGTRPLKSFWMSED